MRGSSVASLATVSWFDSLALDMVTELQWSVCLILEAEKKIEFFLILILVF